nr:TIGR00341 family protein [Chitinophagaceae bacterium]
MSAKKNFLNLRSVVTYLKFKLRLSRDKNDMATTIENVRLGASMTGANLWVLVLAIFTASLGLNVNSTAVIIGAMLISPLMGPIVAIGMGV